MLGKNIESVDETTGLRSTFGGGTKSWFVIIYIVVKMKNTKPNFDFDFKLILVMNT